LAGFFAAADNGKARNGRHATWARRRRASLANIRALVPSPPRVRLDHSPFSSCDSEVGAGPPTETRQLSPSAAVTWQSFAGHPAAAGSLVTPTHGGPGMKNLRTVGWLGVAVGLVMLAHVDAASAGRAGQTPNGLDKDQQYQTLRDACSPRTLPSGERVHNPSCFKPEEQPTNQGQGHPGAAPPKAQ
jgi:hypothetical protein